MRLLSLFLHLALVLAMLAVAGSASAEALCRTVLPDGRAILSRPMLEGNMLVCGFVGNPTSLLARRAPLLPSMRFTTGTIGPFTTGEIGPFTTGEVGPFTTFSNTPAGPARTHR
jgi:hypothetical protein